MSFRTRKRAAESLGRKEDQQHSKWAICLHPMLTRRDMRLPWACINEGRDPSGVGGLMGKGTLCDRSWHMHTLTRSHVLAISQPRCHSGQTNRWNCSEALLLRREYFPETKQKKQLRKKSEEKNRTLLKSCCWVTRKCFC